jgi:hypothetical protein
MTPKYKVVFNLIETNSPYSPGGVMVETYVKPVSYDTEVGNSTRKTFCYTAVCDGREQAEKMLLEVALSHQRQAERKLAQAKDAVKQVRAMLNLTEQQPKQEDSNNG